MFKLTKKQLIKTLQLGKNAALELAQKNEKGAFEELNIYEDMEHLTAEYIAVNLNIDVSEVGEKSEWFNWEHIEQGDIGNDWDIFSFEDKEDNEYITITEELSNELLEDLEQKLKTLKGDVFAYIRHLRDGTTALKFLDEQDEETKNLIAKNEEQIKELQTYIKVKQGINE